MKKNILIIFLVPILGFYSCNKCKTEDMGKYYFAQEDKLINPYTGNETLIFKDSIGNSVSYVGAGRNITMSNQYTMQDPSNYDNDCMSSEWYVEEHRTVFWDNNTPAEPGHIKQNCGVYIGKKPDGYNDFEVSMYFYTPVPFQLISYGHFKGKTFYCSENEIMTPISSLTINSKTFFNVYRFNLWTQGNNCNSSALPPFIYYTLDKGIVGLQTSDYKWWNLDE
jgi:hypothetical protein